MIIDDTLLKAERNNLTVLRLVLASAVILTHCYWRVYNIGGIDGFSRFIGVPLSVYAVDGFFFLSGFLVYQSLERRRHVGNFMLARLARMFPALFVSVMGTVLVGAFITSAPFAEYFRGKTAAFILGNLSFTKAGFTLTGVMCGDVPCNVNGSLWTLPWEMYCYLLLAALGLTGLSDRKWMIRLVLPATLVFAALWTLSPLPGLVEQVAGKGAVYLLGTVDRLWTLFALGIAAAIFRAHIRLSWILLAVLFVANIAAHKLGVNFHLQTLCVGYAILCFGFLSARNGAISGTWPDYSYGMYIYAFPVMMAVAALVPTQNHWLLAAMNFALTLPVAALSWHFVEHPVLEMLRRHRKPRPDPAPAIQA